MLPTWMIEEIERRRREREVERRPGLHVEVPGPEAEPGRVPPRDEERPSTVIVIEF